MISIPFYKYSGTGNDFILIDHRRPTTAFSPTLIRKICHRNEGVGADGVIFLENSHSCDARMRIFNADGSEAEMCGNGLRCLAQFMLELGFTPRCYTIETMERVLTVEPKQHKIKASMGPPTNIQFDIDLHVDGATYTLHYLDTGVPHTIFFVDKIEDQPVLTLGSKLRNHPHFAPKGTNVNFVEILSPQSITIRTYERGVEGETLACGTGAVASAIVSALKKQLKTPIEVKTKSQESLHIDFHFDTLGNIQDVFQTGCATKTFQGVFYTEKGML